MKNIYLVGLMILLGYSCKEKNEYPLKVSPDGPGAMGELTFWTDQDYGCGYITVDIEGEGRAVIEGYIPSSSGISECGISGFANFSLPYKTYIYNAYCDGKSWTGEVIVSRACTIVLLDQ